MDDNHRPQGVFFSPPLAAQIFRLKATDILSRNKLAFEMYGLEVEDPPVIGK